MEELLANTNILRVISYPRIFKPEECEKIISLDGLKLDSPVYIQDNIEDYKQESFPQVTDLTLNNNISWIFERVEKVLLHANKNFFKFGIRGINVLRVNKYDENRSFEWHTDIGNEALSIRKLTIVVFLSKKEDYEGGELKWWDLNDKINQEQGSVALFPPYMLHCVTPITKGVRYTLACW
ncbi:MAG: 2OG-Fe(II) oxygenase, partial [Cyanobacteriota bacterium]